MRDQPPRIVCGIPWHSPSRNTDAAREADHLIDLIRKRELFPWGLPGSYPPGSCWQCAQPVDDAEPLCPNCLRENAELAAGEWEHD